VSVEQLTVSPSPHIKDSHTTKEIMWWVFAALVPALVVSVYFFGWSALRVSLLSIFFCVIFEFLIQRFMLKVSTTICDGSAAVTGLLLAFNLPSTLPTWMIIVGAFVAIAIGKMSFGGLGKNPFNPALVGRVFLLISFPVDMTSWALPFSSEAFFGVDAKTGATVLGMVKEGIMQGKLISAMALPSLKSMFAGNMPGSLGEVSALALFIGGIALLFKRIISWHIPVAFLGTLIFMALSFNLYNGERFLAPLIHLLAGGAMLGAFFMATDMVTSPMTRWGQIIFGIGCGVLTYLIRTFGAYPEGVSFAILIMNALVPLIDKMIRPRPFGVVKK